MGALQTKSPLERRNTIARRSQRRSLHNLKSKTGQIQKKIRKFKDTETTTENYNEIKREIEHLKNEMSKIGKELQPPIRNLYENLYKGIREVEEALNRKLEENCERHKLDDNRTTIQSGDGSNISSNNDKFEEIEVEEDNNDGGGDSDDKIESTIGKNVELMAVKFEPITKFEFQLRSPEEKRKSILKVGGVPVMPGAMLDQLGATIQSNKSRNITNSSNSMDFTETDRNIEKIKIINEYLREIEMNISCFIGKKNGIKYQELQNKLKELMYDLNDINSTDDIIIGQVKTSKNYVISCMNFLNEKAEAIATLPAKKTENFNSSDDVFLNNNDKKNASIVHTPDGTINSLLGMKSTAV